MDLAEEAGFENSDISRWETGKNSIGLLNLQKVAQALGVSVSYLTLDI